MVVYTALLPHYQFQVPLILTAITFVILVALFFYSLSWDVEVVLSEHLKHLEASEAQAAAARVAIEGSQNSSEPTVASRIVGITNLRVVDQDYPWANDTVELQSSSEGSTSRVLRYGPVSLSVRK